MKSLGFSSSIYYFSQAGRENTDKVISIVHKRCLKGDIKKVLIFAAMKLSIFKLKDALQDTPCSVYAVSFPYKQEFINLKDEKYIPETSLPDIRNELQEKGVYLIQGVMPFSDIIIPGVRDSKLQSIIHTLKLISEGAVLCVQAALMACDGGTVEVGEDVIVMSADTAFVVNACQSRLLFHPEQGMKIKEILCKSI